MLIGLHGKKQAGKDTAYARIKALGYPDVTRRAFADKLYASAAAALGLDPAVLRLAKEDPEAKIEVFVSPVLEMAGDPDPPAMLVADIGVRWYLQLFGTEAHRDIFGDDFWVDQVDMSFDDDTTVCITDCRFPNEARRIREAGGFILQVIGPPEVEENDDMHASEFPLPADLIDYCVFNDRRDDDFASLDEQLAVVLDLAQHDAAARQARHDEERTS